LSIIDTWGQCARSSHRAMPTSADLKSDDYYRVLGVDRGASEKDIDKAFKLLALKHHPDKNPNDKEAAEERFKVIKEAHEVLRDSDKRAAYDQFGKQGADCQAGGGAYDQKQWASAGRRGTSADFQMHGADAQDISDLFEVLFGGGGGFAFQQAPGSAGVQFSSMPGGLFAKGGTGHVGAPNRASVPEYALPIGTSVIIHGLSTAPEHNGKMGRVRGFDPAKSRYEVDLGESSLSLKPRNLTQQCKVVLRGIESKPALNGQQGVILGYDDDACRYRVMLEGSAANGQDVLGLEPGKVMLKKGTRVTLQNLSNHAFNGLLAQITEVDTDALRYTVRCQTGKTIKIALDKVLC